jgi:hypothetical protein
LQPRNLSHGGRGACSVAAHGQVIGLIDRDGDAFADSRMVVHQQN